MRALLILALALAACSTAGPGVPYAPACIVTTPRLDCTGTGCTQIHVCAPCPASQIQAGQCMLGNTGLPCLPSCPDGASWGGKWADAGGD